MATIAEQIIKQAGKQAIQEVKPIQQTTTTTTTTTQTIDKEEDKWWFSSVTGLVKDLVSWAKAYITKPSLSNAVDPYGRWQETWFKSDTSAWDIDYIQQTARDKNEAYSIMKQRWYITDETKANDTLDKFYKKQENWATKNVPEVETKPATALDKYREQKELERQTILDSIQKKSYDVASKNIWDFSALRAAQEQKDALNKLTWTTLDTVVDIKKKQIKLQEQWITNPELDKDLEEAEKIQSYTTKRLAEIADMQAKFWGTVTDSQNRVKEEVKAKWFSNLNEYILQDVHKEMWVWNSFQSYQDLLLTRWAKADFEYQKSRKIEDAWDLFSVVFNSIWDWVKVLETSYVNPALAQTIGNTVDFVWQVLWVEWAWTFAEADVSSLSTYAFTDEWAWVFEKYMNKILWASPEVLTFWLSIAAWDKWISKVAKLTWVWALAWNVTVGSSYSYKLFKWMNLTDQTAMRAARALDNVAYTVWNLVPKEVAAWFVWNSFDPESWSKLQEHFWMLDVAFGGIWGVMRQVWLFWWAAIKNLDRVLQTPEDWAKYLEKWGMTAERTSLTPQEVQVFNQTYKQLFEANKKLFWVTKAVERWDMWIDSQIVGLTSEQFNTETKKALARSSLRDLYIKNEWQLTDADRLVLWGLQKLVADPKTNVADVLKISYNIPWKLQFMWFESSALTKADEMLRQLDFKYNKAVDEVFTTEWWKPDNVLTTTDIELAHSNSKRKELYKNLFIESANDTFRPNPKYFDEIEDWFQLNSEWYTYLWIADLRKDAWQILSTNKEMTVTEAIRESATRTWDTVPESFLQSLEKTNLVEKLISLSWC